MSKEDVFKGIEGIARRQGLRLVKAGGKRAFVAHAHRISGAFFAYNAGAKADEVCDLGGWKSIEIMKKYLRGVPFSRCSGMSVKLAAAVSTDTCRLTSQEAALVGDAAPLPEGKPSTNGNFNWRHLRTGLLHRARKQGRLGCGAVASEMFARVSPALCLGE